MKIELMNACQVLDVWNDTCSHYSLVVLDNEEFLTLLQYFLTD